jgi:tetratricopeptide (TPR) repeat protein
MNRERESFDRLFVRGDRALRQGKYQEAIDCFEKLQQETDTNDRHYFDLQRGLVKAYKNNEQFDKAIELCKVLATSQVEVIRIWGEKFLRELAPNVEIIRDTVTPVSLPEKTVDRRIKLKSLSAFKEYCRHNLLDHLKQYEQKRLQALTAIIVSGVICLFALLIIGKIIAIGFGISWQSANLRSIDTIKMCLLSLLIFGYPWWLFYQSCVRVYGLGFKRDIIQNIINFIDENGNLEYASQLFIEDRRKTSIAVTHSQLFQDNSQEPDFLEQEDCVRGKIGNTQIFFAEVTVKNSTEDGEITAIDNLEKFIYHLARRYHWLSLPLQFVWSIGKTIVYLILLIIKVPFSLQADNTSEQLNLESQWSRKTLFRGLFFMAKFSKNFPNRTFLLPNDLSNRVPLVNYWRGEVIKLEDLEFDRLFRVYGDDQIESRYVLSTSLMQRLVDFNRKAKRKVHLSFIEGYIYLAIPYDRNLFEPKLWQTMLSFQPLKEYFEDLQLAIAIVEDLNLNCQIWQK